MSILIVNPPWRPARGRGVRAGARPARVLPEGSTWLPWPAELAFATTWLRQQGVAAWLVDSLALGESPGGFIDRLTDLTAERVAFALSPASLADDLPLLLQTAARKPTIALWPGSPQGAARLLQWPGLQAVVCGEPEQGLLAAWGQSAPAVYPEVPLADLADLPAPWRDYTVHRYRYPWAPAPDEPVLAVQTARAGGRQRPLEAVADEIATLRRNFPRLGQAVVLDPDLNRDPARLAGLADALAAVGLPWGGRLDPEGPWPMTLGAAASWQVRLRALPGDLLRGRLLDLARTARVSLEPSAELPLPEVTALATALAAPSVDWLPPPADLTLGAGLADLALSRPARPRRLLIVGADSPEYMVPWLLAGARELGHPTEAVDLFDDPARIERLLATRPDDLVLFDRGHGVPPELIARIPGRSVLYFPDNLPCLAGATPFTRLRYEEFCPVALACDDVILHDHHALDWLRREGHQNVRGVVPLPIDPHWHRDYGLPRTIDLLFMGTASEHRRQWLQQLADDGLEVTVQAAWGARYIRLLNQAKVVLNLHFTEYPNTELRIAEALACGAMVVTEPTTDPPLFRNGQHVVTITRATAAETIRPYLADESLRRPLIAAGQALVLDQLTGRRCIEQMMALLPEKNR